VKDLAQETAKATHDISEHVESIQVDTHAAVEAIDQITAVIGSVNGYVTAIASAVEEQTATTTAISRSVADAATGASHIAGTIAGLADTTQRTSTAAERTQNATDELTQSAADLRRLIDRFQVV
jgi:methyl-accepting chemotaxis protein